MKRLLFAIALLPAISVASGKLSVAGNYFLAKEKLLPSFGLSVNEQVAGPLHVSLWSGLGWKPKQEEKQFWFTSSADAELYFGPYSVGMGYKLEKEGIVDGESLHSLRAKLSYQLW
jgi:hypothetical protein